LQWKEIRKSKEESTEGKLKKLTAEEEASGNRQEVGVKYVPTTIHRRMTITMRKRGATVVWSSSN
jgi:hypothetical protein